jgi:predicted GNAT family acetyltransferase
MAATVVRVVDNPGESRFEAWLGDALAGFVVYRVAGDRVTLIHTEVDTAFEGQGVGGALARAALDDARTKRRRVIALCPFVARFITAHPEYADLVA